MRKRKGRGEGAKARKRADEARDLTKIHTARL
jgi:hypothetical protein